MIPESLKKEEFRFVLLRKQEKKPFEPNWCNSNYKYDDPKLLKWITEGNNYGVIGGFGNLLIMDFDDETVQNKIVTQLPETLTILTGSGKMHKYFICKEPKSFKVMDSIKRTLIDIQGVGKQVVGPGSTHPNGNKYVIIEDKSIAEISLVRLKMILSPYLQDKDKLQFRKNPDILVDKIKNKISIISLLQDYGYDLSTNPTMCKLGHDSKGGKCFSYSEHQGVWHCFHCDEAGDIFSLTMKHEGISFIEAKKKLLHRAGIHNEEIKISLKKLEVDYEDFARSFYDAQPYFFDKGGLWWLWNHQKCLWEMVDETDLYISIQTVAKDLGINIIKPLVRSQVEIAMQFYGREKAPMPFKKHWVQFKDQIFDLDTGSIIKSVPEFFSTNTTPYSVGDSQDTPFLDNLFTEWVGKENIGFLYDIIAFCLLREYSLNRIFFLVGSGSNGKSVFLKVLRKFLGNENCSGIELDDLLERFGTVVLHRKLACMIGETNFNVLSKTSLLKKISGGDLISFEYKGKTPFSEETYAKLIIATNSIPATTDITDGFFRRMLICEFNNKFTEQRDVFVEIPEFEYSNLALKCLYNLRRILLERTIRGEGTVEERKERYEMHSNPLKQFIKEECVVGDGNDSIPSFEFFERFISYLKKRGQRLIDKKDVYRLMISEGFESIKKHTRIGDDIKNWYYWFGLKFKGGFEVYEPRDPREPSLLTQSTESLHKGKMAVHTVHTVHNRQLDESMLLNQISNQGTDYATVIQIFTLSGFSHAEIDDLIEKSKIGGLLFEPKPGFLKKL